MMDTHFCVNTSKFFTIKKHKRKRKNSTQYLSEELLQFKAQELIEVKVNQQREKNLQNNLTESKLQRYVNISVL